MSKTELQETPRASSLDISIEALEELATKVTKLVHEYFEEISDRPVFPKTYAGKTTSQVVTELAAEGTSVDELMDECRTIIDSSRHNGHPRFFGYVASPSTPIGAYSDLIASALNSNVTCWRSAPAGTEIERMVVAWLGSLIGYAGNSRGLLTSGGSMANLIALLVASRRKTGSEVSAKGLWNSGSPLTMYVSREGHMSIPKAADVLGLGREHVRSIGCDDHFRMNVTELRATMERDLRNGLRPFCVVASAGTVATGAVDPLDEVADVASDFGLWFHVDGAYGAPAALDPTKKFLFHGLPRANSVSLDPHKWLYVPVDAGCLLFRDDNAAFTTFGGTDADYIKTHGYLDEEAFAFWDYGVELSRRFRALKVWLTLRYYGARRIADAISDDIALATYFGQLIDGAEDFELLAPVELSICCFRYVPPDFLMRLRDSNGAETEKLNQQLDDLNARIMSKVQTGGNAYVSNANIRGRFALRACITNFRTTRADIEKTVSIIREAAHEVA